MTADGTVKVADFGIAHLPAKERARYGDGSDRRQHSLPRPRAGGGGQSGKPADVYALGCVLYHWSPSAAVHGGTPGGDSLPARRHRSEPPSLARPELAGAFETFCCGCSRRTPPTARPRPRSRPAPCVRSCRQVIAALPCPSRKLWPCRKLWQRTTRSSPPRPEHEEGHFVGGIAVLATGGAVLAGVLLNGNDTRLPPTTEVGPQSSPSTPTSNATTTRTASTAGANQPNSTKVTSGSPLARHLRAR